MKTRTGKSRDYHDVIVSMVSALDSGASGPGSSPGQGHCAVLLGKKNFTLTVPLSSQVYKWVPANLMPGVTL